MLLYLAILLYTDVFDTITVNFLPVGHTHEDIDQLFSRISQLLRKSIVKTVPALFALLKRSFTKEGIPPVVRDVDNVPNFREWLSPILPVIDGITNTRCIKMWRKSDGKVYIQSKQTLSEPDARFLPVDGFLFLDSVPEGNPCKVPLKSKHLDAAEKTVKKYSEHKALNEADVEEWATWIQNERLREQRECSDRSSATGSTPFYSFMALDSATPLN